MNDYDLAGKQYFIASTTICSGCGTGSGRRIKPLITLNTVVFTAIPSPNVTTAMIVKLRELSSVRAAYRGSCQTLRIRLASHDEIDPVGAQFLQTVDCM